MCALRMWYINALAATEPWKRSVCWVKDEHHMSVLMLWNTFAVFRLPNWEICPQIQAENSKIAVSVWLRRNNSREQWVCACACIKKKPRTEKNTPPLLWRVMNDFGPSKTYMGSTDTCMGTKHEIIELAHWARGFWFWGGCTNVASCAVCVQSARMQSCKHCFRPSLGYH